MGRRPHSFGVSGSSTPNQGVLAEAQALAKLAVGVDDVRAGGGQQLDDDVVGAGLEVLVQPGRHLGGAAVGDERVDQRVAAATAQVLVAPAKAAQVAGVVDQTE